MQDKQKNSWQWAVGSRQQFRTPPTSSLPTAYRLLPTRSAFTLTELLIVIAIMAVLTGLIATAAVNAMRSSRRSSISLDIQNISGAIENFKNDYGAYPPNGMNPKPTQNNQPAKLVPADFKRMFDKAFPGHREPAFVVNALCGAGPTAGPNVPTGMSAAEALVFWLGGFSEDKQYPISGPNGPSFSTNDPANPGGTEVLEDRNWRYEFDITKLGPRNDDGTFAGRLVNYEIDLNNNGNTDPGELRRINLWTYRPGSSEQPLVYFDVSRYKPYQYDVWATDPMGAGSPPYVFALKTRRSGTTGMPTTNTEYQQNIVFVDQGKFQILHSGIDDAWGQDFRQMSLEESTGMGWGYARVDDFANPLVIYPDGPFIGEVADTLTSFTDSTIADATEE